MAFLQSAVVHPLGLAGYGLALIFGLVARYGPTAHYPWLFPLAIGLACVAVLAGLLVALQRAAKLAPGGEPMATTPE